MERSYQREFLRSAEPEPKLHDPEQRPEQKRMGTRYQLGLAPFRLCGELISLRRKDGWRCKLAHQRRKPEPELGRWPHPFQRRNFSCHLRKKTS
ncbi:hypothetical protein DY000_02021564 [Brassica cretica]|uniref:Uncharacterized protein n=1 Tax=Brassica cretica TaxID=69181 RepID=A0ABQ7EGQ7_BRACR|nr:hypothetical protein DY000_02021564 [Brassica cretica]